VEQEGAWQQQGQGMCLTEQVLDRRAAVAGPEQQWSRQMPSQRVWRVVCQGMLL
jgi:hypothetical protein